MKHSLLTWPLFLLPLLCLRAATTPEPDWQAVRDHQPAGLQLKLSLPKDHFFQGEEIPATVTFSNQSKAPYHTWIGTYDRSGRISDIQFYVHDEAGKAAADPLEWYFKRTMSMGGGIGNWTNLGKWSATFPVNLWHRFDHPGIYTIYVWSNRAMKGAFHDSRDSGGAQVTLVSDPLKITIDPLTPQDEQSVIAPALAVVSKPDSGFLSVKFRPAEVIQQLNKLSYLRTPAALKLLLPFLADGDTDAGRCAAYGLLGAPDPKAEASFLLGQVEQGHLLVGSYTAEIYAKLKTSDFPGGGFYGMTLYKDGAPIKNPFDEAYQNAEKEITDAAIKSAGGKGPVAASACWAAFQANPQDPATRAALASLQLDLPADQRSQLISTWQSEIWQEEHPTNEPTVDAMMKQQRKGGPDLYPILRVAAGAPDYNPDALKILCKVLPDEARVLVIEDIKRDSSLYLNKPKVHFPTPGGLDALPDQPIPELTETFRKKLRDKNVENIDLGLLLPLVRKYGTPDLLPDLEAFYLPHAGNWECSVEVAYLQFLIKWAPQKAEAAFAKTLHSREKTRCYAYLLDEVFTNRWNDLGLPIAQKALQDIDPEIVIAAIKLLKEHGGQEYVESSVAALERVRTKPHSRVQYEQEDYIEKQSEQQLAKDLLQSKRWTYTSAQKGRLNKIAGSAK